MQSIRSKPHSTKKWHQTGLQGCRDHPYSDTRCTHGDSIAIRHEGWLHGHHGRSTLETPGAAGAAWARRYWDACVSAHCTCSSQPRRLSKAMRMLSPAKIEFSIKMTAS